jgi:hypothetical protein
VIGPKARGSILAHVCQEPQFPEDVRHHSFAHERKMARNIRRKSQGSHTSRKGKTGESRRRKVMGLKPKNETEGELIFPSAEMPVSSTALQPNSRTVCQVGKPVSVKTEVNRLNLGRQSQPVKHHWKKKV